MDIVGFIEICRIQEAVLSALSVLSPHERNFLLIPRKNLKYSSEKRPRLKSARRLNGKEVLPISPLYPSRLQETRDFELEKDDKFNPLNWVWFPINLMKLLIEMISVLSGPLFRIQSFTFFFSSNLAQENTAILVPIPSWKTLDYHMKLLIDRSKETV